MAVEEVLLPRTSDAMTEAVISQWLVADQSVVSADQVVAEVETDKVVVDVLVRQPGMLVHAAEHGASIPVGTAIAYVLSEADVPAFQEGTLVLAGVSASRAAQDIGPEDGALEPTAVEPPVSSSAAVRPAELVFASPLARRLARESGLNIQNLSPGSGPRGRVVREDVSRALEASRSTVEDVSVPLTTRQRSLASAMARSKAEVPHFYLVRQVRMDAVMALRKDIASGGSRAPSVTVFCVRALGIALHELAFARRIWDGDGVREVSKVGVGVAVSVGELDIVVPVILDPQHKSLDRIASELGGLSQAVRENRIRQEQTEGAIMTISNLGMHGVDSLLPIVPPRQGGIVGVGRSTTVLVRDERGAIHDSEKMVLSLVGDHRSISGVGGAKVLGRLDELLQQPWRLLTANPPHGPGDAT